MNTLFCFWQTYQIKTYIVGFLLLIYMRARQWIIHKCSADEFSGVEKSHDAPQAHTADNIRVPFVSE